MTQEEMGKKLEEVMADEAFVATLADAPNVEAAQQAFKSKGLDFTTEELEAIVKQLQENNDEIGEDQLEAVSGGIVYPMGPISAILRRKMIIYTIAKAASVIKW